MHDTTRIRPYLCTVFGPQAELIEIKALGEGEHDTGVSTLLDLTVRLGDDVKRLILRRPAETVYAEQRADRALTVFQARASYDAIARHPRALDVAAIGPDGTLHSVPGDGEFVLLHEYAEGELYLHGLLRDLARERPSPLEERRAVALAEYLAGLHEETRDDPRLYRRSLREMVGGSVGVMGVLGGYSEALRAQYHGELRSILERFAALAWDLTGRPGRLCRAHGDFHPLNVLFDRGTDLRVIDATGPGWSDPAFDVGTMLINYYALHNAPGRLGTPAGRRLAERFLATYEARCPDREALHRALPLPLARGALIMATTDFFPDRPLDERGRLIRLASEILSARVFSPDLFGVRVAPDAS